MLGAIIGDMAGSPYEFKKQLQIIDFPLLSQASRFTDDTVMTIAVAEAFIESAGQSDEDIKQALITSMQKWGRRYPHAGYGKHFKKWLFSDHPVPYGSYGNGAAMRVASAGWLFDDIHTVDKMARLSAEVSHNHPEGIKGAQATAAAIFMAGHGASKKQIKEYISATYGYDLSIPYRHLFTMAIRDVSCQVCVSAAMIAFLSGDSFEDVIRRAVLLGGDTDTIACIAGGIAEVFYGVSENLKQACLEKLDDDLREAFERFDNLVHPINNPMLKGCERIEKAIADFYVDGAKKFSDVMMLIHDHIRHDGHFIFPIQQDRDMSFTFRMITYDNGCTMLACFTSFKEGNKGMKTQFISTFADEIFKMVLDNEAIDGIVINPWGQKYIISRAMLELLLREKSVVN